MNPSSPTTCLNLVTYWAWYGLSTFRHVYRDSRVLTVFKTLLVMVPYMTLVLLTGLAIMALVIFRS